MPGSFTDYYEDILMNLNFGRDAFTEPANHYYALSTTTIDDTGSLTEPTGNGYARVLVANTKDPGSYRPASGGVVTNFLPITFPQAVTGPWSAGANMTDVAIFDAITAGNMIAYAPLDSPRAVLEGDTLSFPTDNITISLT